MTGKLYAIGIGPGDPELMTLKAARILKEVPVLLVPKGREEGVSLALSIAGKAVDLDGKEIVELHFPMKKTRGNDDGASDLSELDAKWDENVAAVLEKLDRGMNAAFITIGDPGIYSTFFYLYDRLLALRPELAIEIVPGISSINAAAARAGMYLGLGNDRIAVLPANYLESLRETLEKFDTVVLMKVNKVFDAVKETLATMKLTGAATYIVRAGMDDEGIYKDIMQVRQEDLNYFSLVIVRKR